MLKAYDVSLYFLFLAGRENAGDTISNLKIQKMLYYAQGHYLAIFGKPLFDDPIEAWDYGPVVKAIYDKFKKYGRLAIDFNELENFNASLYDETHLDILPFVFKKYNGYGAWELRDKTHNEAPWRDTYEKFITKEIPQDKIKAFFEAQLKSEAQGYLQ